MSLRFFVGVVKVQSEKKACSCANSLILQNMLVYRLQKKIISVSRTQVSFAREAKEIGGACTQASRITIRVLKMYSYIIDNFRMGLNFIVSFGWSMRTR